MKQENYKITVAKYGKLEIISGGSNGTITVWWLKTGKKTQECNAHNGQPVTDLQFDATKIVSCGMDNNVNIIDIMTGAVIQTLRGHEKAVLCVSFDKEMILSMSKDGTIRCWNFGIGTQKERNNVHIVKKDESILDICREYNISPSEIMAWNDLGIELESISSGQKLVVARHKRNDKDRLGRNLKSPKPRQLRYNATNTKPKHVLKLHSEQCATGGKSKNSSASLSCHVSAVNPVVCSKDNISAIKNCSS